MTSTKSASDSVRRAKWRLSKTLKRKPQFRLYEEGDKRFLWAAYKAGQMEEVGPSFEDTQMDAKDFALRLQEEVLDKHDAGWTLGVENQKHPVGVLFGFWPHREDTSPYMIVGEMIWFPWATARNKVEAAVNFFNEMRGHVAFVEYADLESKPFFEMIAKHGIMRRVGTSYNVYPGQATSVFETRGL